MDSDFVTGMIVGGSNRAAGAWEDAAHAWKAKAEANDREAMVALTTTFGLLDVLATLPIETRVGIYSAMKEKLAPTLRSRFLSRKLSAQEADESTKLIIEKIEAAWTKTVAAASASTKPRR
jgi:hypothetical protein